VVNLTPLCHALPEELCCWNPFKPLPNNNHFIITAVIVVPFNSYLLMDKLTKITSLLFLKKNIYLQDGRPTVDKFIQQEKTLPQFRRFREFQWVSIPRYSR
jgi:hypothetical protein